MKLHRMSPGSVPRKPDEGLKARPSTVAESQSETSGFSCFTFSAAKEGLVLDKRQQGTREPPEEPTQSPGTPSSLIFSRTHFLISRPMALESGGGTALPT